MVPQMVWNFYKGKSCEPIKLDSHVDLRQWSRDDEQARPSQMKLKGVAIRRTSSMVHSKQYAAEANSRRESRRISIDGTARGGYKSTVGVASAQPSTAMSIGQTKNAAWLSNGPKTKEGTSPSHQGFKNNPFWSSMGTSPELFLNSCLEATESSSFVANNYGTDLDVNRKAKSVAAPVLRHGDGGEQKAAAHSRVALLQQALQVMLPGPLRRTKCVDDFPDVAEMSDSELAQRIVSDEEQWARFKRSLQERTESGRRIFTHATLQHELPRKMRESAQVGYGTSSPQVSTSTLREIAHVGPPGAPTAPQVSTLPVELKVEGCDEKCHFQRRPTKFAPRSKKSAQDQDTAFEMDTVTSTQWKVVPRRRRLIARKTFYFVNKS
jgi:hypothetical protein